MKAIAELQRAITTAPILISLTYGPDAGLIILAVDASLLSWGAVLMQLIGMKRHPTKFESGTWDAAKQKYDATKRECRGVLKAFKRLRNYLYGVLFLFEIDAKVLVHQINGVANDMPRAFVIRWLA